MAFQGAALANELDNSIHYVLDPPKKENLQQDDGVLSPSETAKVDVV